MCYKNIKYFSMQETEKEEFLENQLQSELHSHAACHGRASHERAVQQEHISQSFPNLEHNEAKLRVRVQTEEPMMTSMMEGLSRNFRKREASCTQRTRAGGCSSNEMSQETDSL